MKTYVANELNQYTAIDNPDAVGLRGDATNNAMVTLNGEAAIRDNVASDVQPWHYALPADNANGGEYTFASIVGVVNPPGTNEADIVSTTSGSVYAPPQNETLTYDDDGNLLSDGRWHYTWNGENRLICAEEQICPTNRTLRKVEYAYDHQGRMVWKRISHGGAEAQSWEEEKKTSYLWDNFNIIAETTVADSATNTTFNVWGLDIDGTMQGTGGVGGLLAVVKDSATYIPAYDANGNVMEYVSDDGAIAAHREYDPFGGTVVATGEANAFTHWFSTKPWCAVTGLSEYQYRKYRPVFGRWLSRDPIEEDGSVNILGMVQNDVISRYDIYGLKCCLITMRAKDWHSAGHSILYCDDGHYISWYPKSLGNAIPGTFFDGEAYTLDMDFSGKDAHFGNLPDKSVLLKDGSFMTSTCREGTVVCLACLNGKDLPKPDEGNHFGDSWNDFNNCADETLRAADTGLVQQRPKCKRGYMAVNILARNLVTTPRSTEAAFLELKANNCTKWKCVKKPKPSGGPKH